MWSRDPLCFCLRNLNWFKIFSAVWTESARAPLLSESLRPASWYWTWSVRVLWRGVKGFWGPRIGTLEHYEMKKTWRLTAGVFSVVHCLISILSPAVRQTNYVFNPLLHPPTPFTQIITLGNHNEFVADLFGERKTEKMRKVRSPSLKRAADNYRRPFDPEELSHRILSVSDQNRVHTCFKPKQPKPSLFSKQRLSLHAIC